MDVSKSDDIPWCVVEQTDPVVLLLEVQREEYVPDALRRYMPSRGPSSHPGWIRELRGG